MGEGARKRRRQATRVPRARQARDALVEAIPDSAIILDAQDCILDLNSAAERLLGQSADALRGRSLAEVLPSLPPWREAGPEVQLAQLVLGEGQARRCYDLGISPIFDQDRRYRGRLVLLHDVTGHERARQALAESEEHYRLMVDRANDGIAILQDGQVVYLNARLASMWGEAAEDILGTPFGRYVHPGELPRLMENYRRRIAGDEVPPIYETVLLNREGHAVPVEVSAGLVSYRGRPADLVIIRDISERKRAEAALQESQERYRRLVELLPDGIAVHQDGLIRLANLAGARMLGYETVEEVIGRPMMEFVHPEDHARVLERVRAQIERGEVVPPVEERFLRRDGTVIPVEVAAGPFTLEGRPASLVVIRDIGARQRLEAQLRQAQKMEAVARLAGGVAHDLNNLLTAISGYGSFLLEGLPADDPLRQDVRSILEATEKATGLIKQLLAFGRRQVMEAHVIDMNEMLINVGAMLRRLIGEDIELKVIPAQELVHVRVDPVQLEQVIVNLVVNACEAMPTGGQLILETASVELDLAYAESHAEVTPGPYVLLSVNDTGVGMSPEVQEHLFEPFFTTKAEGTGLGLATAYGIIRQFGGHIRVYSEEGRGTTFKIYLPRVEEAVQPARPQPAVEEWPRGTETILLVEDNDMVRNLAAGVLRRQGYTVLEACRGEDALEVAAACAGPIHLLLTDVVLPQMSGRAVLEALAAVRPGLRVLYVSGYTDNVIARHGILEEGVAFLSKPFTPKALVRQVRRVLDREE